MVPTQDLTDIIKYPDGYYMITRDQYPEDSALVFLYTPNGFPDGRNEEQTARHISFNPVDGGAIMPVTDIIDGSTLKPITFIAEPVSSEFVMTYQNEINSVHPLNSDQVNVHKTYELALKLVSERHAKYALVDLVHWLIMDRAAIANAGVLV